MPYNGKRILIFVVAYNAEETLRSVLDRVPAPLRSKADVLVIDDFSEDATYQAGIDYKIAHPDFNITALRTPENQGYGGNQKLGYRYAIEQGYDIVALLHGDGQYSPERLPDLIEPLIQDEADAVLGSRFLDKRGALEGGMPLYKFIGNRILSAFQNRLLGTQLSEFHSGYRIYTTGSLRNIPFECNTDGFAFDTEIIIQLLLANRRIKELPVPTYYGKEICRVNGLHYAWRVAKTTVRSRLHQADVLYDRRYDLQPERRSSELRIGYPSSHTFALDAVKEGGRILNIGCGQGAFARLLVERGCEVTGIDRDAPQVRSSEEIQFIRWDLDNSELPLSVDRYHQILMLDVIEHLEQPEAFMQRLRGKCVHDSPEIILSTVNVAFIWVRLLLLIGRFNYGRRGILDRAHRWLFTFRSLQKLLQQSGYRILETKPIPAPWPKFFGDNRFSALLLRLNKAACRMLPGLFAYQICTRIIARPTPAYLLARGAPQPEAQTPPPGEPSLEAEAA